jgi:hypothetical protein
MDNHHRRLRTVCSSSGFGAARPAVGAISAQISATQMHRRKTPAIGFTVVLPFSIDFLLALTNRDSPH